MAINPDKKTRKERREARKAKRECQGSFCAADEKAKKQKTSKSKKADRSKFVAHDLRVTQGKTTDVTNKPGMDVTHSVIESGKPTKSVDYTADAPAENIAKVESIGGKVTSSVSDPTVSTTDETTKGGLKRKYYSKGLYKQAPSGDISKIKGYSTYSEDGHQKELIKQGRGGNIKTFKAKSDDPSETRALRKLARKSGTDTKYVSEDALGRKTKRISKSISNKKRKIGHKPEKFLGGAV
jgi:hypothetical protein